MVVIPLWVRLDEAKVPTARVKDQLWISLEYSLQTLTHSREDKERSTLAVGLRSLKGLILFACLTLPKTNP